MDTLRLRADNVFALIDALHMLRTTDDDGAPCWLSAAPACDVDPCDPIDLEPAVVDPLTGEIVSPAVIAAGCHLNIYGPRPGADPAVWAEIVEAASPYALTGIANPRRERQA